MSDIVVASSKKINIFDKIIQNVIILMNITKMNRAIDEHIDKMLSLKVEEEKQYNEKILREIVYVKYQYDIMQRTMYELKLSYPDEVIELINTTDKLERLKMQKTLFEMEYDRITKAKFKSKEDVKYRLLTIASVLDRIKQEIKDEGKNERYGFVIKCSEEINQKLKENTYTDAMYDQLISYVNDYVGYINDNYDIVKLPKDERDIIEFVIEATIKGIGSDIEKYMHEFNLLVNIYKNAYIYFNVIDKIFEKIQNIYDESLCFESINIKDYIKFFSEIYDTKIKTKVNDVKRTIEIEDEYMEYCRILMEEGETLDKYIVKKAIETSISDKAKVILEEYIKEDEEDTSTEDEDTEQLENTEDIIDNKVIKDEEYNEIRAKIESKIKASNDIIDENIIMIK